MRERPIIPRYVNIFILLLLWLNVIMTGVKLIISLEFFLSVSLVRIKENQIEALVANYPIYPIHFFQPA